jgi:TPR repeat protein
VWTDLGIQYQEGLGVEQSLVQAYAYELIAQEAGGPNAEENLRQILPQLSQEELKDAHRRAAVWKAEHPRPGEQ